MSKKNKIILSILISISIIIGTGYYLLIPDEKIELDTDVSLITTEDIIKGSFIDNGEILKNPLRIKGTISLTNNDFKNVIYTIATKNNLKELNSIYTDINENKVRIIVPYNILGIDTLIKVNIEPHVENNKLYLGLVNLQVGKIKISDKIVASQLEKFKDKLPFEVNNNKIIVEEKNFLPIILDDVSIKENKIIVKVQIVAKNVLEFINQYNKDLKDK